MTDHQLDSIDARGESHVSNGHVTFSRPRAEVLGVILTGLDGTYLWVDENFASLLGYTPGEIVGKKFMDFTDPQDLVRDTSAMHEMAAGTRESYSETKHYIRRDSSVIPVSVNVTVIRDVQGKPEYFATYFLEPAAVEKA